MLQFLPQASFLIDAAFETDIAGNNFPNHAFGECLSVTDVIRRTFLRSNVISASAYHYMMPQNGDLISGRVAVFMTGA